MEEEDERSGTTRDSCYFPGCRRDANCDCKICLASLDATLDLMSVSIQQSSLTKLSASRTKTTPISFDRSVVSKPRSMTSQVRENPSCRLSGRLNLNEKVENLEKKEGDNWNWGFPGIFGRVVLVLSLVLVIDMWFFWAISEVFRPVLSPDMVRNMGEKALARRDLNWKTRFLENELQGLVKVKVSNCSHFKSKWEINQDNILLNSKCLLYKSAMEEVSIWGWPLKTAGLLTTGFSHRSFTVLSGRVTEWSEGRIGYSIRKANNSWVQKKWSSTVVQFDPNTWVLEYGQSSLFYSPNFHSVALEFLKFRMLRVVRKLKHEFCLVSSFDNKYGEVKKKYDTKVPT